MPAYLEPTPRRSRGLVVGLVVAAVVVLLCGLGGVGGFLLLRGADNRSPTSDGEGASPPRAGSTASPGPSPSGSPAPGGGSGHTVVYEVSGGPGSAIITYTADGAPSPDRVELPWRMEVTVADGPDLLMVLALQFSRDPLTCRILVDGQAVAAETSENSVTCTHLVGN